MKELKKVNNADEIKKEKLKLHTVEILFYIGFSLFVFFYLLLLIILINL